MKKIFEYKGYKFLIEITLHALVERHPGGKDLHKVNVSNLGSQNYQEEYMIDNNNNTILVDLECIENHTKAWVDSKDPDIKLKNVLTALGYE